MQNQQTTYTSSNLRKHTSGNPLQQWLLQRFHAVAAELLHTAIPTRIGQILDAGCGEGISMHAVLGTGDQAVVGLDGSVGALKIAQNLAPQRPLTAGDLLHLPFANNQFELVVCMEVLEHLDDPEGGLAELCRVSKGWLLLSVPNEPLFRGANFLRGKHIPAWGNDPGHVNHWSARHFHRFVSHQCRVVQMRRSFPWTLALCSVA